VPPPIRLRPARPADAEAVGHIWRDGWRDGHLGHVPAELAAVRTPESFLSRAADRVADTVVAAAHRGSGVAAALIAEAERAVAAAGHTEAWLAVVGGNTRARRSYERCGWSDAGPAGLRGEGPGPGHPAGSHAPLHLGHALEGEAR